jgi:hypothetical protein
VASPAVTAVSGSKPLAVYPMVRAVQCRSKPIADDGRWNRALQKRSAPLLMLCVAIVALQLMLFPTDGVRALLRLPPAVSLQRVVPLILQPFGDSG